MLLPFMLSLSRIRRYLPRTIEPAMEAVAFKFRLLNAIGVD
jgi:hypothetical protein